MNIIDIKNITKTFIDGEEVINVLRGIDLQIQKGDFVSITGASGTGKSTLLYQLGLLDNPTSGEVVIDGVNSATLNNNQKTKFRLENFGFVFQDYALLPELTAWENVAITMLMRGDSKLVAKQKAIKVLEDIGMGGRAHHTPDKLSGGENQRVSIARAIVHKPKILFADEPTANLDNERSRQIIDIFKKLNKEGQTIVMITHETEYADETNRKIVISDGKIISS